MKQRIEFNMHSNYSRMNGIKNPGEIIDRAIELGMDTIAITDIGSVKGLPEAYDYIKMNGKKVKLILGMEAYYKDGKIYCEVENEDEYSRIIILVQNETGRKNLYKLISAYYKDGFAKLTTREGLLVGTNGWNSDVIHYLAGRKSKQEVKNSIRKYDFILVSPLNYHKYIKQIVSYAKGTATLVIASNSPYYFSYKESIAREVLRFADNKDTEIDEDLSLYSTEDMLNAFEYLGDKAEDIVINNGHKLAEMIDDVPPIPQGCYPDNTGQYKEIKKRACLKACELYGEHLPEPVKTRLKKELRFISRFNVALYFWIPMKISDDSKSKGYPVILKDGISAFFVSYLLGITHVNPLKPHYRCRDCFYTEFFENCKSYFDLSAKKCPNCGKDLHRDGHDIPYEMLFSVKRDKEPMPNINLNLSEEYRNKNTEFIMNLLGCGKSIREGVSSTLSANIASFLAGDYFTDTQADLSMEEQERISKLCKGAFRKTNVNPARIIYLPDGYEIEDFTPIEIIEDDYFGRIPVTHYSCWDALYDTLFNCEFPGSDDIQMLKLLKEKAGVEPTENDIADNIELLKAIKEENTDSLLKMYSDKAISVTDAHSVDYMIASFKLLWYKLNYPNEFQEADYEVNGVIPTDFKRLDEILKGGFRKGQLSLIEARPGVGKTTFSLQIANKIANDLNKKVAFFSLELSKKQIEEILYKQDTGTSLVEIDDTPAIDTNYIKKKLIETEADIAVIDYLELIKISEKKDNRVEEVLNITYELRRIAEKLNVAVVVTMQLSNGYGKQINKLKHYCSLEGVGFSDQNANIILFLNRDDYYDIDRDYYFNAAQIIVTKNMHGNIGTIDVTFDFEKRLFKEI